MPDVMRIDKACAGTARYVSRRITGFMWREGLCGGPYLIPCLIGVSGMSTPHNGSVFEERQDLTRRLESAARFF